LKARDIVLREKQLLAVTTATDETMYVKEISLDGFKSYAQRVDIPGFDPQFNAITGLNGSGKSNILDSICFVLGIQNLQQVRVVCSVACLDNLTNDKRPTSLTSLIEGPCKQSPRAGVQTRPGWCNEGNCINRV
jgi:ABC-type uncharacterized transport system ATPase component